MNSLEYTDVRDLVKAYNHIQDNWTEDNCGNDVARMLFGKGVVAVDLQHTRNIRRMPKLHTICLAPPKPNEDNDDSRKTRMNDTLLAYATAHAKEQGKELFKKECDGACLSLMEFNEKT